MTKEDKAAVLRRELPVGRILVISDIHGDRAGFERLLEKLRYVPGQDGLVLLGDYVNRGPEGLGVVRRVMELCRQPNVVALRGNNDVYLRYRPVQGVFEHWNYFRRRCIFGEMLAEAGLPEPAGPGEIPALLEQCHVLFARELDFLYGLPDILETQRFLFAHAGLGEGPLEEQELNTVLSAEMFLRGNSRRFEKLLLIGHWPTQVFHPGALDSSPAFRADTNVLSIDGGNQVKRVGQLNGIVLDNKTGAWSWDSVDSLEEILAPRDQQEEDGPVLIWPDNRVTVLEQGERSSRCRAEDGRELTVPTAWLYQREDGWHCDDISARRLAIRAGEPLGLLADLGDRLLVKKRGQTGILML